MLLFGVSRGRKETMCVFGCQVERRIGIGCIGGHIEHGISQRLGPRRGILGVKPKSEARDISQNSTHCRDVVERHNKKDMRDSAYVPDKPRDDEQRLQRLVGRVLGKDDAHLGGLACLVGWVWWVWGRHSLLRITIYLQNFLRCVQGHMGDDSSSSSSTNEIMIVVALCCCCSLAVALFLWYAYNNQSKFTWLNWFYKLFGSTPADTPAASDTTGGTSAPASTSTPVDTPVDTSTPKTPKAPATLPKCTDPTFLKSQAGKDFLKALKAAKQEKNKDTKKKLYKRLYDGFKTKCTEKFAPLPENEFW